MSAADHLGPQFHSHDSLPAMLNSELGHDPKFLEGEQVIHPKSGYPLRQGLTRQVHHQGPGEGPAVFQVHENRPFDFPFREHVGTEPIQHVYRGMSHEEWSQAQERGHIQSDQRGTLAHWEGTNAAVDPRTAAYYLPRGGEGVVAKIRVKPEHEWFTHNVDNYVRTRKPIPLDAVEKVTRPLRKDEQGSFIDDRKKPR